MTAQDDKGKATVADIVPLKPDQAQTPAPSIDRLLKLAGEDIAKVNQVIVTRMDSRVALIPTLAGHIIAAGGKRLRPLLTLAAARLVGYRGERHIKLAACVEFIHTATLLHDDVVDESDLRRGNATANVLWGNQASVLVGDFLFTRSFQLMVEDGSLEVLNILANASAVIAEGEVQQLQISNDTATTGDAYLEVITAKTAALFAAACEIGAVVAGRPAAEQVALASYGKNLGIAFQLVDDALDYAARQEELGKTIGDDFREGKITLPVVLAFRRGTDEDRAFLRRCLEKGEQGPDDLKQAIAMFERLGAIADTIERARHYGAMARDALAIFPQNDAKLALNDVVEFCIARAH